MRSLKLPNDHISILDFIKDQKIKDEQVTLELTQPQMEDLYAELVKDQMDQDNSLKIMAGDSKGAVHVKLI